ncbi:MAG: hypothetical protein WBM24_05680 [Candidatus Sulfotelmatobacter sp.]
MRLVAAVLVLAGASMGQASPAPSPNQFVGTYTGTWQSQYLHDREGTGAAVLSITVQNGALEGRVMLTGSPVGYKGDALKITVAHFADDIMTINFKAKHGRLAGTGIFQNGTFVGDYRFRYLLTVDRGQWNLQK